MANGAMRAITETEAALLIRGHKGVIRLQDAIRTLAQNRPTIELLDMMQTALQDVDAALAITGRWLGDLRDEIQ